MPSCSLRLAELLTEAGLPKGVLNVVNGGAEAVDAILAHPGIGAVSFVGSTAVAEHVYRTGTARWKTRPGPGRREEPHGGHARRRYRPGGRRR